MPTKTLNHNTLIRLRSKTLPKSLDDAAGLLKDRYSDLKAHYRTIRREWPSWHKRSR